MESTNGNKNTIAAIAVVVGLVVGGIVGGVAGSMITNHNDKNSMSMTTSTAAVAGSATPSALALNNTLVTLGLEHMTLTNTATNGALDGSKDASATAAQLYANGDAIGKAVGSVYGSDAEKTFDTVWKLHLDEFVNYTVAASKGDTAGKQTALDKINTGYTIPLAQYLAKANPNLPEDTLQSLLSEHVAMTAMIIDDHAAGKYTQEQTDLDSANQMMTKIFSTLAGAIAKQFPDKFAN